MISWVQLGNYDVNPIFRLPFFRLFTLGERGGVCLGYLGHLYVKYSACLAYRKCSVNVSWHLFSVSELPLPALGLIHTEALVKLRSRLFLHLLWPSQGWAQSLAQQRPMISQISTNKSKVKASWIWLKIGAFVWVYLCSSSVLKTLRDQTHL